MLLSTNAVTIPVYSSCARPAPAYYDLREVQKCIIVLDLEYVQQKREIFPGLSFCGMLDSVSNMALHSGPWVYGVHCRLRFAKCQEQ